MVVLFLLNRWYRNITMISMKRYSNDSLIQGCKPLSNIFEKVCFIIISMKRRNYKQSFRKLIGIHDRNIIFKWTQNKLRIECIVLYDTWISFQRIFPGLQNLSIFRMHNSITINQETESYYFFTLTTRHEFCTSCHILWIEFLIVKIFIAKIPYNYLSTYINIFDITLNE